MLGKKFNSRLPQIRLKVTFIQFRRLSWSGDPIFFLAYIDEAVYLNLYANFRCSRLTRSCCVVGYLKQVTVLPQP